MRFGLAIGLALLAMAVFWTVSASAAASSVTGPARAQAVLARRLDTVETGAIPPLLSMPADAAMIRAALDPRDLQPVDPANLGAALDVCDVANRYSMALTFVGSRKDEFEGAATDVATRAIAARVQANAIRYQDELALSMRFSTACMARLVEPLAAFWNSLPADDRTQVRLDGLHQMKRGMTSIYLGLIISQGEKDVTPANRTLLLETLLAYNAQMAQALTHSDRAEVVAMIGGYLPAATGRTKADLTRLKEELARLPCTQLCAID